VAGPHLSWRSDAKCEQCGGVLGCSNCENDGTYPAPALSTAVDGRSALAGLVPMDYYRERAGIGGASETFLRAQIVKEARRKENAELERRRELTADWRRDRGM
jgi:hypothetical protein